MVAARDGLSNTDRITGARSVAEKVAKLPSFISSDTVLTYAAIGSELDTEQVISRILDAGKHLVLSRVVGDSLTLHRVADPSADLIPGRWDIPEPRVSLPRVMPAEIGLFLLPGLAFDTHGRRLGYGRGFFDRMLDGVSGNTVGLAFDVQLIATVPTEPWDVALEAILTPSRLIHCRRVGG